MRSVSHSGATSDFSEALLAVFTAPPPPEGFPVQENVVHLFFEPMEHAARYELQWRRYGVGQVGAAALWRTASGRLLTTTDTYSLHTRYSLAHTCYE